MQLRPKLKDLHEPVHVLVAIEGGRLAGCGYVWLVPSGGLCCLFPCSLVTLIESFLSFTVTTTAATTRGAVLITALLRPVAPVPIGTVFVATPAHTTALTPMVTRLASYLTTFPLALCTWGAALISQVTPALCQ